MTIEIPPIISVDDHVVEPPDLWERWLPAKYRDVGPHVVRSSWELVPAGNQAYRMAPGSGSQECDFWVYGSFSAGIDQTMALAGIPDADVRPGPIAYAEMRPGTHQVPARLADMDMNDVERSLCFPTFPRFCGQVFLRAVQAEEDRDLASACIRAYNDWIVDEWSGQSNGRLIPLQIIPLWDPELAAEEIVRNAARGVNAVTFSELPQALGLPSLYDRDRFWDPLFRACNETHTVICVHIGSASRTTKSAEDSPPAAVVSLTSLDSQMCLTDWVMSGTLGRFPNLKLALSESQVGWIPYQLQRLDDVWRRHRHRPLFRVPEEMVEPPSHYVRGRVYGCVVRDDFGLQVHGGLGVDALTFESDYPHADSTWPSTKTYAEEALADFSQADVDKVIRQNALKLFRLPERLPNGSSLLN